MPLQPTLTHPEDKVAQSFSDELDSVASSIAAEMGPAPGSRTISDARAQAIWWQRDPQVDQQLFLVTLQHQGLPPQIVAPLLVVKEHPEWAPLYMQGPDYARQQAGQQGTDPEKAVVEVAEILASFAAYPYRAAILASVDDPTDRAKEAERLTRKGPPNVAPAAVPALPAPVSASVGAAQGQARPSAVGGSAAPAPMAGSQQPMTPQMMQGG